MMDIYQYGFNIINLVTGILFNAISIYILSCKKNSSEIGILLITQFTIGMLTLILTSIVGSVTVFYDDHLIIMLAFLKWLPQNSTLHKVILLVISLMLYTTIIFPVEILVVRYMALCKSFKITRIYLFMITIISFMISLLMVHSIFYVTDGDIPVYVFRKFIAKFEIKSNLIDEDVILLGSYADLNNWKISILDGSIYMSIYSSSVIFSIYNYLKYMKSVSSKITKATRKLHVEFLRISLFQMCLPFIIFFTTIIVFLIFLICGCNSEVSFLGDILSKLLTSIPAINPMLYIFLSKNNRDKFFSIFKFFRKIKCNRKKINNTIELCPINYNKHFGNRKGSRIVPFARNNLGNVSAITIARI
uniref:G_PROTEIN_RECEP_F1_2 domain-containing protein n=1 Tax=Strongyloides venezuelensis TaxID=75913 RepID=A0A0K0EYH7_STRVS